MSAVAPYPEHDVDLARIRHSAAHVMAQAVTELFPGAQLGIGPAIEDGFYYDFDLPRSLTPDDLAVIEARMREIVAEGYPFIYRDIGVEEARSLFRHQPYKLELIDGLEAERAIISTYRHDSFEDRSGGPHVVGTSGIPVDGFRLTHVSGAYWRGDEK